MAGNGREEASPHPPWKSSGTEERAGPQRILGTGAEVSSGLYHLACPPTASLSASSHLSHTPQQMSSTCPSLEKAKAPPGLLTEGPISPRLEDVAGSTEALYESGDTLTAASPGPQGAQQGVQNTLHHGGKKLR